MKNQRVKFFLKNSMSIEGIVLEESESAILLTSSFGDKGDRVVIQNPGENVIMYIIFGKNESKPELPDFDLEVDEEILNLPEQLKLEKIADLKIQQQKMHEEYIRQQMTTFSATSPEMIGNKYGSFTDAFNDTKQEAGARKKNNLRKLRKL